MFYFLSLLAARVAFRGLGGSAATAELRPQTPVEGDAAARERTLLAHLARDRSCSTAEVASALKVSEMTAFRTLRGLLDRGLVARTGKGRNTRYAAVDDEELRG